MLSTIESRIENILHLLQSVANEICEYQENKNYEVYQKEDGTIVTDVDFYSHVAISQGLKEIFGEIEILSEENDFDENVRISKLQYFFLLDPLDGTKSFHKGDGFSVNLCFCVEGKPVISFIFISTEDCIIFNDSVNVYKKCGNKIEAIKVNKHYNPQPTLKMITGSNVNNEMILKAKQEIVKFGYNDLELIHDPALTKLSHFIYDDLVDGIVLAGKTKDWDILPIIPILDKLKIYFSSGELNSKDKFVVNYNNDFSFPVFFAIKDQNLFYDVHEIWSKIS